MRYVHMVLNAVLNYLLMGLFFPCPYARANSVLDAETWDGTDVFTWEDME